RMALIPFRVQIVAKRPDRSRINVMRSVHKIKPDSRGSSPAMTMEGVSLPRLPDLGSQSIFAG
ncbi:MAG: hypothetical protein ACLPX9_03800, partial [Rhodomicrobium sp.]